LDGQQGGGADCLFQQESLVVEEPVSNGSSMLRVKVSIRRIDRLKGRKEFNFLPLEVTVKAAKAIKRLRAKALGENDPQRRPRACTSVPGSGTLMTVAPSVV